VPEAYAEVPDDSTYVACGFYTPDYHPWLPELIESLTDWEAPYHFVRVPKARGGWERNTMAKPQQILAAMDCHPDRVIVWLDVDCVVYGDLSPLAETRADVAFRMHSKYRRWHKGTRFRAQSGTMVFRPTPEARQFVENWKIASEQAPHGEIDQSSQVVDGHVGRHHVCAAASDLLREPRRVVHGGGHPAFVRQSDVAAAQDTQCPAAPRPRSRLGTMR
jgi:hypothetical protein